MTSESAHPVGEPSPPSAGWLNRILSGWFGRDIDAEGYRRLAIQLDLEREKAERGISVMLASPDLGRVSEEIATKLAQFLATEMSRTVLVIDGTFAGGSVGHALGHSDAAGLAELLRNGTESIVPSICSTPYKGVSLLTAGRLNIAGTTPLKRERLKPLLDQACTQFDYVLIPVKPILNDAKALVFAALVDQVLMLVAEGRTLVNQLDVGRKILEDCGARRVGIVLTKPGSRWLRR